MDIKTFFDKTQFPIFARKTFEDLINSTELLKYDNLVKDLTDFYKAENAYNELIKELGEDPDNLKITALEIKSALLVYEKYHNKGISEEIYFKTMEIFSRYVETYFDKNNKYFVSYFQHDRQCKKH
jgi:hypothetical protein